MPVADPWPGLQTQSKGPVAATLPEDTSGRNTVPAGQALIAVHCSGDVAPAGLV